VAKKTIQKYMPKDFSNLLDDPSNQADYEQQK
jgi:hypothetical protein